MSSFEDRVRSVVAALDPGEVVSYGEVAEEAGFPGAARAVGGVLARTEGLPWWRVVTASGRLAPGHEAQQARLLAAEGVSTSGGHVRNPESPSRRRRSGGRRRGPVIRSPHVGRGYMSGAT